MLVQETPGGLVEALGSHRQSRFPEVRQVALDAENCRFPGTERQFWTIGVSGRQNLQNEFNRWSFSVLTVLRWNP
jgi:hypothetical protein